jgi:protein-disulfide isomerase
LSGISEELGASILNELRQIRQLLERAPRLAEPGPSVDQVVTVSLGSNFVLGRMDAPLTIVEFTDLQCPFCRRFHLTAFEEIRGNWIETGKVRFVSRDFPLDMHDQAMPAAVAARCAHEQGKFWEMRHTLILNASGLSRETVPAFASSLQLEMPQFESCLRSEKYKEKILFDVGDGRTAGISGTPTFIVGRSTDIGVRGTLIVGAQAYAVFHEKLRDMLKE